VLEKEGGEYNPKHGKIKKYKKFGLILSIFLFFNCLGMYKTIGGIGENKLLL